MLPLASWPVAVVLAFHPFSVPPGAAQFRSAPAEPSGDEQPGWDAVEKDAGATEPAAEAAELPPPTVEATHAPTPAPAPVAAPPPSAKPEYKKGTGLIIGASITGGLAWVVGLSRMAFVKQCQDALEDTSEVEEGFAAASVCFKRAGAANLAFVPLQWVLNWATWGLAPAAGVVRGRYDGVEHAWSHKASKKTAGFIGAGAALLAVGIIGRITAAALFAKPYQKLGEGDTDGFFTGIRVRYFGVQLSSATIGLGAGLLGYGVSYRKNYDEQSKKVQQVRFAPEFSIDRASGTAYTGFSLSGRF